MRASLVVALALLACSKPAPRDDAAAVPRTPPPSGSGAPATAAIPTARVTLEGASGPVVVAAEVVKSPGRVQKGLMFRKHLPADGGMLFVMPDEDDHHFWMHNTYIPLDILFITGDRKVAGILENMKPHDDTSRGVGKPSRYVLEVNAGWAKAHGVAAGTAVRFEGIDAAAR